MLIRRANQFNPVFKPVFGFPQPPLWRVPPQAFPHVVPFNNDGVFHHSPGGGGILEPIFSATNDAAGRDYNNSGMEDCPRAIAPTFKVISLTAYDYNVDLDNRTFELVNIYPATALPPEREFVGFDYSENLPPGIGFPSVINILAVYYPRWQYPNGDYVKGAGTVLAISISDPTGIAINDPPPTVPEPTATEIAYIAFGIPYTDAEAAPWGYAWDGTPQGPVLIIDDWLEKYGGNLFGRGVPIGSAKIGGIIRDVYGVKALQGSLDEVQFAGSALKRYKVGYQFRAPQLHDAYFDTLNQVPPFNGIFATAALPGGGDFWNVWKGPRSKARKDYVGYIFHRGAPQFGTEDLNPPEGEVWLIYDHAWSVP